MRQGYGMTEAGPVLSMCPAFAKQPLPAKSGSCGSVVRNAELTVVDPETGCSLGRNQPGEICIRGAQIMKGYYLILYFYNSDRRKEMKLNWYWCFRVFE